MAAVVERLRAFEGREQPLLLIGALLLVVHAVNHVIAEETADPAPTIITTASLLAALLYRVLPKIVVVAVALFAGVTHTVGGALHIGELLGGDPQGGDYTGPFSLVGSLLLFAVGVFIIVRWFAGRRSAA